MPGVAKTLYMQSLSMTPSWTNPGGGIALTTDSGLYIADASGIDEAAKAAVKICIFLILLGLGYFFDM